MEKLKDDKDKQSRNHTHKLLAIPGIEEAISVVREHSWSRAYFDALMKVEEKDSLIVDGDSIDEWLESLASVAGPKIAELWDLSEDAGLKLVEIIYFGESSWIAEKSYLLPFVLVVDSKDKEITQTLRQKYLEFLQNDTVVISPEEMKPGRIYLDVTYLKSSDLKQAYKAIGLCRKHLNLEKQDLREGAPASINTEKALKCFEQVLLGKPSKQIAREFDFRIYTSENPSGSSPLFRKYKKRGSEILEKLEALEDFLIDL